MKKSFAVHYFVSACIAIFIAVSLKAGSLSPFMIPKSDADIQSLINDICDGKINLENINGKYALPKTFKIDNIVITYIKIENGIVKLLDNNSVAQEYTLIKSAPSIDTLITAKNLGTLLSSIPTISGKDPWSLLSTETLSLVSKNRSTSEAVLMPLRFCYLTGSKLFFFSAEYALKQADTLSVGSEKPIGGSAPLKMSINGVDIYMPSDMQ
jgi:hypothetical protein